jgi:hypothetical protein
VAQLVELRRRADLDALIIHVPGGLLHEYRVAA